MTRCDKTIDWVGGEFKVGDKVVMLNWDNNSKIYTVSEQHEHKIYDGGVYCYSTYVYSLKEFPFEKWFSNMKIRPATPEEIAAGHRIDNSLEILRTVDIPLTATIINK